MNRDKRCKLYDANSQSSTVTEIDHAPLTIANLSRNIMNVIKHKDGIYGINHHETTSIIPSSASWDSINQEHKSEGGLIIIIMAPTRLEVGNKSSHGGRVDYHYHWHYRQPEHKWKKMSAE
mmetsp:Transcript_18646/g.46152  ORF Transcript_18646/g.46152 Transcript_18646/m.46152 type:complete len:121 (-) Transcript_18646:1182-1544(-)